MERRGVAETRLRCLGVVVARLGSKRVARKVLRPLGGHPLLAWMVRAALNASLDDVILSTEDAEVAAVARRYGIAVPFIRPQALAVDGTRNDQVLAHALDEMEAKTGTAYDVCVLLQATAPFVRPEDIDRCVAMLAEDPELNGAFAARPVREQPNWMFRRDTDGHAGLLLGGELIGARQLTQSLDRIFLPAGSAWAVRTAALRTRHAVYADPLGLVEVPMERAADIDEELDLIIADALRTQHGFALLDPPRATGVVA